jgi:hypothetical protein
MFIATIFFAWSITLLIAIFNPDVALGFRLLFTAGFAITFGMGMAYVIESVSKK